MGFLDALLGKRKVKGPAPDRLFAITTAAIALETGPGIRTRGSAAIVFQPLATGDFAQIVSEMEEVVRGTGYPFVPAGGPQQRSTERELQIKAQIGAELPVEAELERWCPLWGIPI